MGAFAGGFLRLTATFFYALEFCCAAIILGVYSYFLSVLSNHNLPIAQQWKAVEGMSGIAVIYTIFAVILTCFLGGIAFFAFLGILLDVLFAAAFIALAVLTRAGSDSCTGNVNTPLGSGPADRNSQGYGQNGFGFGDGETVTYFPRLSFACRINKAAFAVSIIGAFLFFISAGLQIWVARHHQREKKYGPSPANNYTSGSGRRKFWQRRRRAGDFEKGAEMSPMAGTAVNGHDHGHSHNTTGLVTEHNNAYRPSHETGYTGTTQGQNDLYGSAPKVEHGGYHTGPAGTSVNPYGYDNTRTTAHNF